MKNETEQFPQLVDILQFLYSGIKHILTELKGFYKESDHNIVYLTLHSAPLINGLNTGMALINQSSLLAYLASSLFCNRPLL
jgi:hypothetical protein